MKGGERGGFRRLYFKLWLETTRRYLFSGKESPQDAADSAISSPRIYAIGQRRRNDEGTAEPGTVVNSRG